MAEHILALDAGTTGVTAIVYAPDRTPVGRAYQEFTQCYPKPGWVEHDADEIWETTLAVGRLAIADAGLQGADIAAIGITNQRETTVLWDKGTDKPLHHAIVWQDSRTAKACDKLRRKWQKKIQAKTGLVLDPYFSATKVQWLLENVSGAAVLAADRRVAFGTIDSWLTWKLTGGTTSPDSVHATDVTNASRTMLWNIHQSQWDTELLELFGVPSSVLPVVHPSGHVVGHAHSDHFGHKIRIAALVGDQQAALFGQGCTEAGQAKNTYGTGCFLMQHTGTEAVASKNGLLTTRAAGLDGIPQFALEGSVFVGGAAIQWLRDGLGTIQESPHVNREAALVDDTDGVTFVPAFTGLGAPYWNPDARGALLGITRGTTHAHIARATLEGIALQSMDVVHAMEKDAKQKVGTLRVDGGATKSDLLMQIQADLLRCKVERPADVETTSWGAASLAGITVGLWSEGDAARDEGATVFKPRAKRGWAKGKEKDWKKAVKAVKTYG